MRRIKRKHRIAISALICLALVGGVSAAWIQFSNSISSSVDLVSIYPKPKPF